MLKTYRSLLSIPHARAFVLAGFVARLSMSMRALGAVLMISTLTGSYGLAGAIAAAALLGEAVAAPRLGRLVDRYGQRRVLLRGKFYRLQVGPRKLGQRRDLAFTTSYSGSERSLK
jgi:MFS family permease